MAIVSRQSQSLGVVILALAAALAAGCGSEDTSDRDRVTDVVREVLTTHDPAWCREHATERLLGQLYDGEGRDAVVECERYTRIQQPGRSVAISRIEVSDDVARARAAVRGGDLDGMTYDLALVKPPDWRIDRVTAVELDFERYLRATRRYLTRPPGGYTDRRADCVIRALRERGEDALERAIVAGDDDAPNGPGADCTG